MKSGCEISLCNVFTHKLAHLVKLHLLGYYVDMGSMNTELEVPLKCSPQIPVQLDCCALLQQMELERRVCWE